MGRLVRIIIYVIAVLLVYFLVINTMDTYKGKSLQGEINPNEMVSDTTERQLEEVDSLDLDNNVLSNEEIVSGTFDYESLDQKVTEIEANKTPVPNKTSPKNEPTNQNTKSNTESKPVAATKPVYQSDSEGKFLVLAGSFLLKENADAMVSKLHKMGFKEAKIVIFTSSEYHSVLAARFDSEDKARAVSTQLKQKGVDSFVKSNH